MTKLTANEQKALHEAWWAGPAPVRSNLGNKFVLVVQLELMDKQFDVCSKLDVCAKRIVQKIQAGSEQQATDLLTRITQLD